MRGNIELGNVAALGLFSVLVMVVQILDNAF